MSKVNMEEIEKEAKKKKDSEKGITAKRVGSKTYFQGKYLKDWYEDRGECFEANQEEARIQSYKEQGLNKYGQTPEAVRRQEKIGKLLKKKKEHLEAMHAIHAEIGRINRTVDSKEEKPSVPKKTKTGKIKKKAKKK